MGLIGLVPFKTMFNSYASTSLVLMIGMMIVGGGMFRTGFAGWLGQKLVKLTGTSEKSLIFVSMISAWALSSVCSGSASMMILLPILCSIALAANVSVSRIMLPFNTGIGFGSFMTLAGSGMCSATAAILIENGYEGWSFLDPAKYGLPKAIVGIAVIMLFGYKLLPNTNVKPDMANLSNADVLPEKLTKKMMISAAILCLTVMSSPNMAIVQEYGHYTPMDIFKFGVLRTVYGTAVALVFIPLGWL